MKFQPFKDESVSTLFQNLIKRVTGEIEALDNEYVLKASQTELEDFYTQEVTIEPLVLYVDQRYIDNRKGKKVNVTNEFIKRIFPEDGDKYMQGTQLDIAVPWMGHKALWQIRPSQYDYGGCPMIEVRGDSIILSFSFADGSDNEKSLEKEINEDIARIAKAVENLSLDVKSHNLSAPGVVRDALTRKREIAESTMNIITALNIPINKRGKPLKYIAPIKRRRAPINRPKVSTEPYEPEPVLDEQEYLHILDIMRSMSLVIERNPKAFVSLDEEAIRTHFLLQLNGHYEGSATGETFNASGKNDILIRVRDKNIFIAECKFWKGKKDFNNAIDQLLRYMSWRDTKCALIIFNKNKDSSAVKKKMHEQMEMHSEYRRTIIHQPDGDSRYTFVKASDPGKEIFITTQLYDLPVLG